MLDKLDKLVGKDGRSHYLRLMLEHNIDNTVLQMVSSLERRLKNAEDISDELKKDNTKLKRITAKNQQVKETETDLKKDLDGILKDYLEWRAGLKRNRMRLTESMCRNWVTSRARNAGIPQKTLLNFIKETEIEPNL